MNTVVFDKTGTLTYGNLTVTDWKIFNQLEEDVFWYLAGSAESSSEHPLAKPIVHHAKSYGELAQPQKFKAVVGQGIVSVVNQSEVLVGNRLLMMNSGIPVPEEIEAIIVSYETQGKTTVIVSIDKKLEGIIAVADNIKPESLPTIQKLQQMGIEPWLISGDNFRVTKAVAQQLGITRVIGGVLPDQKSREIKDLQMQDRVVAMVGDGVNDSIALTQADIGIAVGSGTDIAAEAAEIVLIKNDLRDIITAIDLSRTVFRRIRINFLWALAYNLIAIPVAAGVLYPLLRFALPPPVAAAAEAVSTLTVVFSSLLLNVYKKPSVIVTDLHRVAVGSA